MSKYILIALLSGVLSAFSQILLKKGSQKKTETKIGEYINIYVIGGYGITFLCMVLMIIAYRGMPYKLGAILESLVYLYVMILSSLLLGEKLTPKSVVGNMLIVCGVAIFSM